MMRRAIVYKFLLLVFCLGFGWAVLPTQAQTPSCGLVIKSDVTGYTTADPGAVWMTLPAGAGGQVAGTTDDKGWIAFEPGVAQAANIGLTRLRWVQASDKISLEGDCNNLPVITPLPIGGCVLTFGDTVNAYIEPDEQSTVYITFGPNDYADVIGTISTGWYALENPGMQAGATGTATLRWIKDAPDMQLSGACDTITAFYPPPKDYSDVCSILTKDNANSYIHPDAKSDATPFPEVLVLVLAKTDGWYGYDPAMEDNTVGVDRLNWVPVKDVDETNGDCSKLPTIDPAPIQLSPENDQTTITAHVGDTVTVFLPGNPSTGYNWVEGASGDGTNEPSIIQQQGQPQFGPDGDRFGGGGAITLTFQIVDAGKTLLVLNYQKLDDPTAPPGKTFTVTISATKQ